MSARTRNAPWAALAAAALLPACIAQTPEQARESALGPEEPGVERGPLHRPGQPCLTCHGEEHNPGGLLFEIAGTVYRRAGDAAGLRDARVVVEDAAGQRLSARTNEVGNFFVRVRTGVDEPTQRARGELLIPQALEFPLRVAVRLDDLEQTMRGLIWREGSCGACHGGEASATSNGVIFVEAGE